jgi:uncharacterized protein YndB with AHSA1/START domain
METINLMKVTREVVVEASQEVAFNVFTEKIDLWWPRTHHIGKCPTVESVLEGRKNGRWYSKQEDGSEADVGRVLEWNPWHHLTLAWQVDGNFQYDPELITEVVVNFIAEGAHRTRVTLEHRDMQKLLGGKKIIAGMDEGWGMILDRYKQVTDEA